MVTNRHPSAATLASYVAGKLGQAAGVAVAAHLLQCKRCLTVAATAEDDGRLLIGELPLSPLASGALQRTLNRIQLAPAPPSIGLSPPPVMDLCRRAATMLGRLGWPTPQLRWVAPGVRVGVLLQERCSRFGCETLFVLRVKPGVALPSHSHVGLELTCVLEGSFADESGRYGIGDMAEAEDNVSHRPVAEGPADCICLIATQGRLRFPGLLGRLVGTYLRI